ncbi:hypothetical protein SADUNF_Sadunf18G0104400 [Salix dunnii]|uniref:Uncharacterized protein n=1 Tax=Salix dunnii TaxID=1413687 RepID=A0A835J6G9_9ROSI|nr:hypothetical protein SADUNF_Sadunf18G0104400 [Salix dunnii]
MFYVGYFVESGGYLHFTGLVADDMKVGISSPDMHDDQTIAAYAMKTGCSRWFLKYCCILSAGAMKKGHPLLV